MIEGVVRWGLIGAGDIAEKRVAPALRDGERSTLVAVARRRAELAEEFARRFGAPRSYPRWEDLLRDHEVDAVYVATPVALHAEIAVAAAAAGKHVLCEKPMAMTIEECERMVAAADAADVLLGVAYYRHLYPMVRRVKELLSSGTLGRTVLAQVNAFERFDPPADHARAWLLDPQLSGGGPMFDFGCHRLEILLHLLGPAEGVAATLTRAVFQRRVEDTAVATVRFAGGALGTVTVSHGTAESRDTVDLYCEAGSIHIPLLNGSRLIVRTGSEETEEQHAPPTNLHQPLVDQFAAAVLGGGRPVVDGAAGKAVNRLLAEIYGDSAGAV
jgi:predicted dehydrogenase